MKLDKKLFAGYKSKAIFAIRVEGDFLETGVRTLRSGNEVSVVLHAQDGRMICLCHGGKDGRLYGEWSLLQQADILICCHPSQVRAQYPSLSGKFPAALKDNTHVLQVCCYWGWLFVFNTDRV